MLRLTIILLLLFLHCIENDAQQATVTISEGVNIRNDNGYEILGRYKENILLFRDKETESEIVAFDENMRQKWLKKIEFDERRPQVLDVVSGKDYFSVIYKAKVKNASIVKINRYDGSAGLIDSMTICQYTNRLGLASPKSLYSENKKTALVYNFDQSDKIEVTAIDIENLKVLWSKNITIDAALRRSNSEQIIVSNQGDAFFIYEKENVGSLFGSDESQFDVFKVNGVQSERLLLKLPELSLLSVSFGYDNIHRQLSAIGLISEKGKARVTHTLWIKHIGEGAKEQLFKHRLEDETVSTIMGKKVSNHKGLSDLQVQNLIFRKDGGIVAIVEEVRQQTRGMTNNTSFNMNNSPLQGRVYTDFYNESLLGVSFNADGSLHWEKVMPKKQFAQDEEISFSSYAILKTPSTIRFLFNDEIKLETSTSEYVLSGEGTAERHMLFNTTGQDIFLRFREALQIGAEEIIIPSEYRNYLKLVKVHY
jgi:hypothetical protein